MKPRPLKALTWNLTCWRNCHETSPFEGIDMKPHLLKVLPWNLTCWRQCHETSPVEGITMEPHMLKALPWNLICWRHCHETSSVEGIAMKHHMYRILTAIVVQEHLYSFLNLHLLVRENELLCLVRWQRKAAGREDTINCLCVRFNPLKPDACVKNVPKLSLYNTSTQRPSITKAKKLCLEK
jgi:hypothetical protein